MPDLTPMVLDPISIQAFIQHILATHAPNSTLIICSTKEEFQAQLQTKLQQAPIEQNPATILPNDSNPTKTPLLHPPSLRFLSTTRTLTLAFCPDITHLRAYLSIHGHGTKPGPQPETTARVPVLAILNPLAQHKPTSAFSAQGLNRTFATAVEAARRVGARLVVGELGNAVEREGDEVDGVVRTGEGEGERGFEAEDGKRRSVWDEEVSILNVTTRSFGAGERGWVGRTVAVSGVVGRWCKFVSLPEGDREMLA